VRYRHRFFESASSIRRVFYINCSSKTCSFRHPWVLEEAADDHDINEDDPTGVVEHDPIRTPYITDPSLGLEVISLSLDEFREPASTLEAFDVVVFDDLLVWSEDIDFVLKFLSHHAKLYTFVISQSCLRSKFYPLLQLAHQVILILGNTNCNRLAKHLVDFFFLCSDTKAYLKTILSLSERAKDHVLLKLNNTATYRPHSHVLALTRLQGLFDDDNPFAFLYAELGHAEHFEPAMRPGLTASAPLRVEGRLPHLSGQFLEDAFVLLPASRVRQSPNDDDDDDNDGQGTLADDLEGMALGANEKKDARCLKEKRRQWNELNQFLREEIKDAFPVRRVFAANNLAKELLRSKSVCFSLPRRTVFLVDKPKAECSVIDFINLCTRRSFPNEKGNEQFRKALPLVAALLKNNVPETYFANRLLLEMAKEKRPPSSQVGRNRRRRRRNVSASHKEPQRGRRHPRGRSEEDVSPLQHPWGMAEPPRSATGQYAPLSASPWTSGYPPAGPWTVPSYFSGGSGRGFPATASADLYRV
jgi:hypothetical protein